MPEKSDLTKKWIKELTTWEQPLGIKFKSSLGQLYVPDVNKTFKVEQKRNKRDNINVIIFVDLSVVNEKQIPVSLLVPDDLISKIQWN